MDQRRAAGALLALVVCITTTAAAPTVSNQTGLDLYDSSIEGCYYNFQHYGEGDRIMTNEPCLNCTCHNRMLMCYLRVCPFTKPIGQDCTVEKRADQCCPIVTCPDVPVDLLTSTTTSPAEYGATGLGKLDKYGCSIHGKYFPEGSKVPPTPNKPCEHCYCIRNMTTCVMQECTLHVDGCTPIYHKDVCCPVRYSCDHPEDETLLLDDMTTTVRPTPGFLLTTTTLSPVTQMTQDCVHDDEIFADGAMIKTEKACEHCYCMKGDIVCVVQECGTPMENEGKNCTSQPPREGQCCPDTYICEGDEITTEPPSDYTTQAHILEDLTTRRVGVEGSGYRNEPDEPVYTELPSLETETEGSGYEHATEPIIDIMPPEKETSEVSSETIDESPYYGKTTTRTPTLEEVEKTTEPDKGLNTVPSDEEGFEPSIIEKTTPPEDQKVTEAPLTSDNKEEQSEDETKIPEEGITTPEEISTPIVTSQQDDSTTEPAFKKEDKKEDVKPTESYSVTEEEATTQTTEFEKEIVSAHDYDITTEAKTPFMEEIEKQTTLSPVFTQKDADQSFEPEEPTTEPILEASASTDSKPPALETTTDVVQSSETTTSPVEKIEGPETTSLGENEVEGISTTLPPGRIPGEGDCLMNEITYRNNSDVPSYNPCDTSCKCISSIVTCDRIICSPPPEYMDNCQPTYDPPGSCCPTYVCHTGETIPPQPHSQMSGTESPLPSPAIECHGDECKISKEKLPPIDTASEKPSIIGCESDECRDQPKPAITTQPAEKCDDGKCLPSAEPCVGDECKQTPIEEPVIVPVKDVPLCDSEEDCKRLKPEVPQCEGQGCTETKVDCIGSECSIETTKLPDVPKEPLCENEEDCKQIKPQTTLCEGEGCASDNVECSGPECSVDTIKPDVLPKQPVCEGEECTNICSGPDCSTNISKPIESPGAEPHKEQDETVPCSGDTCRRKESEESEGVPSSECTGSECMQHIPSIDDNVTSSSHTTENPEEADTQFPVSEEVATKEPESTKDKIYGSDHTGTTDSVSDEEEISSQTPAGQEKYTDIPEVPATEGTKIGEPDIKQVSITETPELESPATTKTEPEKSDRTEAPLTTSEYGPVTEVSDIRTAVPQESVTKVPEQDDVSTQLPGQYETDMQEDGKTPISTTDEGIIEISTRIPEKDTESTVSLVLDQESESPAIEDMSTKLPVSVAEEQITESAETETALHENAVTDSYETEIKATQTPEVSKTEDTEKPETVTEVSTEPSLVPVSEEKETDQTTLYTQAPAIPEQTVTETLLEATTKIPDIFEETSSITTSIPEMHGTEKEIDVTQAGVSASEAFEFSTIAPTSPKLDTVEEDSKLPETTLTPKYDESAEDHDTKAPQTFDTMKDKSTESPETHKIDEDSSIPQSTEKETTESAEKPVTEEKDQETDLSTENPEINEVEGLEHEELIPKVTVSDGSVTSKPDYSETEIKTQPPKQSADNEDSITEEPEISTDEPSLIPLEEHPAPEKIPLEPYIPVYTETTSEPAFASATTKGSEIAKETQGPSSDTDEEVSKLPVTEHADRDETKEPEKEMDKPLIKEDDTQYPIAATESTVEKEPTVDEKEVTENPEDYITKKEGEIYPSEVYTTNQQSYSDVTTESNKETTLSPKIKDEPTDDVHHEYSTVPVFEETQAPEEIERTTEPHVVDSDLSPTTNIPESHVKETQQPEITITDTPELGLSTKHDEGLPEQPVTEILIEQTPGEPQEVVTKKDEETPTMPSQETIEETFVNIPVKTEPEITPEVKVESTEGIQDLTTQEPDLKATQQLPQESSTEIVEGTDTEVTLHDKVTEAPQDLTTLAVSPEKPMGEQQELFTEIFDKLTTIAQPEQPQELSTSILQETTPKTFDIGAQEPEKAEMVTPVQIDLSALQEKTTEKEQIDKEEPAISTTSEPSTDVKETSTKPSESSLPSSDEQITESPVFEEPTIPDLVELEEHSHKPVEDISTISPLEQDLTTKPSVIIDEEKKPDEDKEIDDTPRLSTPSEEIYKDTTTNELYQTSTSAPSKLETPISTTSSPDERFGEVDSDEPETTEKVLESEQYPTSDLETPPQTEIIPQTQEATPYDELIPVTIKSPESSEHTKLEDKPQESDEQTEQPIDQSQDTRRKKPDEPQEKPIEDNLETQEIMSHKPEERPGEKPTDKYDEEHTEHPLEEKPSDATEVKPEVFIDTTEKPADRPLEVPIDKKPLEEEPLGKPTDIPLEEITEKPSEESTEKSKEKPTEEPTQISEEMPSEEPETLSAEQTEKPEGQTSIEPLEKPSETPIEQPDDTLLEEPTEKPSVEKTEPPITKLSEEQTEIPTVETEENPEDKPIEAETEKPTEEPAEIPLQEPTEKPSEEPSEKPSEEPSEKPQEKPSEESTERTTDQPDEKPFDEQTEKATEEVSEEIPQEVLSEPLTEKPLEEPTQKPDETLLEEPTEKLNEDITETPAEKPAEKPLEQPLEEPATKPSDEHLGEPTEEPVEKPEKKPSQETTETSLDEQTDKQAEAPIDSIKEKPLVEPLETPVTETSSILTEKPEEVPSTEPTEKPEEKPLKEGEEKPVDKPKPEEKATDKPEVATEGVHYEKPQEIPVEPTLSTATPEVSKPALNEIQPTDELPDDDHFPPSGGTSGYGTEPDYVEEDQAFGPGTCRYGGKVYVSAQQIPRDDPCDFCFCFRSDIICLQQSCPPPIHGCHEEPIQGFCCPRYECPVAMATTLNVTTTTTTTTTTLPPHFLPHAYKGAAQRRGCQIKGHTYKVGEVVRASSGPCLHCTCGGDGQMKCDPKACTPEPMLRQMIAAAVSASRRR